jgi:hypothetical protein
MVLAVGRRRHMKTRQINLACIILLASALGLALWARYGLIESVTVAGLCNATSVPLNCTIRRFVIATTTLSLWSYVAVAAGAFSVLLRRLDATLVALVTGAVGLVLYGGAVAAVGFLLGCITYARLIAGRNAAGEQ